MSSSPSTTTATSLRHAFVTKLPSIIRHFPLPPSLHPHHHTTINALNHPNTAVNNSTTGLTSWWLAERIILHVLEDDTFEHEVVELMRCVQKALAAESLMTNAFDIVEQVVDVMSYAFQNVTLKNAFDQDNALPTVYYMLLFVMCCASDSSSDNDGDNGSDKIATQPSYISHIRTYEPILARIAVVVHKLLLNQEIFAFVRRCGECSCSGPCGAYGTTGTSVTRNSHGGRCGWRLFGGGCVPDHYE